MENNVENKISRKFNSPPTNFPSDLDPIVLLAAIFFRKGVVLSFMSHLNV